jgi:DNA-binding transcriptional MerR regulator
VPATDRKRNRRHRLVVTKSPEAFRTISEVADVLDVPPHVLRFWESRFTQVRPVKRGGGRRYYRPDDVCLLRGIRGLLYDDGLTIKGVQKILREKGVRHVVGLGAALETVALRGASCQDRPHGGSPSRPGAESRSFGDWTGDAEAPSERPPVAAGFAETDQAGLVSEKSNLNGSYENQPDDDAEAGEPEAMPETEARENGDAAAAADGAAEARPDPVSDPAAPAMADPLAAEDPRRARKAALKVLIGELQALRERMAEGLAE